MSKAMKLRQKNFAKMTLQELKDNRAEIIEVIEERLGENMVKEAMAEMVKFLGFNGIRSTDAVSYAKEVINLAGLEPKEEVLALTFNGETFNNMGEYNTARARAYASKM